MDWDKIFNRGAELAEAWGEAAINARYGDATRKPETAPAAPPPGVTTPGLSKGLLMLGAALVLGVVLLRRKG